MPGGARLREGKASRPCEDCGRAIELARGVRAKVCGECAAERHRQRQREQWRQQREALNPPPPAHWVAAERACVRCRQPFESAWSGDRVCPPCRHAGTRGGESPFDPAGGGLPETEWSLL